MPNFNVTMIKLWSLARFPVGEFSYTVIPARFLFAFFLIFYFILFYFCKLLVCYTVRIGLPNTLCFVSLANFSKTSCLFFIRLSKLTFKLVSISLTSDTTRLIIFINFTRLSYSMIYLLSLFISWAPHTVLWLSLINTHWTISPWINGKYVNLGDNYYCNDFHFHMMSVCLCALLMFNSVNTNIFICSEFKKYRD